MLNDEGHFEPTDFQLAVTGTAHYYVEPEKVSIWDRLTPTAAAVREVLRPLDIWLLGGRGGGKSVAICLLVYQYMRDFPEADVAIFRQTHKSLKDITRLTQRLFPLFDDGAQFNKQDGFWQMSSGSTCTLDALADLSLYQNWQGQNLQLAVFDELQMWPDFEIPDLVLSNLRGKGYPCKAIYAANPGGRLHGPIFDRVLKMNPRDGEPFIAANGRPSVVWRSTFRNNPHVGEQYEQQLKDATKHDKRKQQMWLSGDWSIQGGGFFSDVLTDDNFVDWYPDTSFYYQDEWRFFLSIDHGTSAPAVVLLMAEAKDTTYGADDGVFRRGDLVVVAEVATVDPQNIQKGDGSTIADICEKTHEMNELWYGGRRWGVADDAIFSKHGAPTPLAGEYERHGIIVEPAGKGQRVPGWDLLKQRLSDSAPNGKREGKALYINRRACPHLIYELQNAVCDSKNIADVDTTISDHALDSLRMAVVSRTSGGGSWSQTSLIR
jgi:hypothetical protein